MTEASTARSTLLVFMWILVVGAGSFPPRRQYEVSGLNSI
jgi:hypothetical protein